MRQNSDILQTGFIEPITVEKDGETIGDILKSLNLTKDELFGILVNGKKATEDTIVSQNDEVVIIPAIKGGF